MSTRHAPGLEPFTAKELGVWLTRTHGARLLQQNGAHLSVKLGNGAEVPLPIKGYVPRVLAKTVAAKVGVSYHDLRAGVGHPIVNGHRGRPIRQPRPRPGHATKAQVVALLTEIRRLLHDIDRFVRAGQHDAALYDRLYATLKTVRKEIPNRDGRLDVDLREPAPRAIPAGGR